MDQNRRETKVHNVTKEVMARVAYRHGSNVKYVKTPPPTPLNIFSSHF
jgi:hypothetical protein